MNLDEYLWRNKIQQKIFAKKIGIEPHSLCQIVNKKVSPKLWVAIKIVQETDNQVNFLSLLRDKDLANLK